jgi:type IV secretion system protein VirD4
MMRKLFKRPERTRWASPYVVSAPQTHIGLPALDPRDRELYERALPRRVMLPRLTPDRPPLNAWMAPHELAAYAYVPGQIILGRFAGRFLGYLDDRPLITIAGARAGKTSTILEPNLYLYPGSMLVLDPKGELSRTARFRRAAGHAVHVLDPFGVSPEPSASFNVLEELDPSRPTIVDDVSAITNALVVDDGDPRARHWVDNARRLLLSITLLVLTFPTSERNLVSVRQLLSLTYPRLRDAVARSRSSLEEPLEEPYFDDNKAAVETLLRTMSRAGDQFGGILASNGHRFLAMPPVERGSVFSTAATHTDFIDSLPLRSISRHSDFGLDALRGDRPTTVYLCLPVGRMESHYRWLRLIVQMACTVLERHGTYPHDRAPILFMMEEFATLGHMEIMERAAAYFPGFGIKLWAVLQDITQLRRYYEASYETFLGNASLVQCFANGDLATLNYIAGRLDRLAEPFELRTAFARDRFSQMLLIEGKAPAAALRLRHEDVAEIRARASRFAGPHPASDLRPPA